MVEILRDLRIGACDEIGEAGGEEKNQIAFWRALHSMEYDRMRSSGNGMNKPHRWIPGRRSEVAVDRSRGRKWVAFFSRVWLEPNACRVVARMGFLMHFAPLVRAL